MISNSKKGFSAVELLIVVVAVALIGLIGWTLYNKSDAGKNTSEGTSQSSAPATYSTAEELPSAPDAIQGVSGVDEAISSIDSVDLDSNENQLSELDAELNKF